MTLQQKLKNDLIESMKNGDTTKRETIRFLNAAIKQIEVDERKVLEDMDIIKLIQKAIKQREESIAQFIIGNRDDLVQKEQAGIAILKQYLPKQLDDNELFEKIKTIATLTGATTMKDIGKIMAVANKELCGIADGKRINEMAKKVLE